MQDAKQAIEALCRRLSQAHRDRDAQAVADCYTADAVIYDLAPPLGRRGIDRQDLSDWFATWDGPLALEVSDETLELGDDLASLTALNRMCGSKRGERQELWFRSTMTLRREGSDGWRISHHHTSVPFYMDGSFAAALDLTPGARVENRLGDRP